LNEAALTITIYIPQEDQKKKKKSIKTKNGSLVSSKNSFYPDPEDNNFDETLVSVFFSGNFDALQTSQVEKWFNGPFSSKKKKGVLANKHSNRKPSLRYVLLTKNQQHSTTSVLV
jgi:hypothetical protein